ncbi:MAG: phosphotransferase [Candidatus Firestonebacteria bacterium]
MTEFNPNHPAVKKLVEKHISDSLGFPVEFVLALPVKEGGGTLSWRVETCYEEKKLFVILKTPKEQKELPFKMPADYDFFRQYRLLKQLEGAKLKTPKAWGADEKGAALGLPCFLEESLRGRVLYNSLKIKEDWADSLFLKTIIEVQNTKKEELGEIAQELGGDLEITALFSTVKKELQQNLKGPLVARVLEKLSSNIPGNLKPCFSNGNFSPKNIIAKDKKLTGVIDFEFAGYFDPLYEFLLPFEKYPLLKNRGLEESYCREMGFKTEIIDWYRGLIVSAKLLEVVKEENKNPASIEKHIKQEALAELSQWAGK